MKNLQLAVSTLTLLGLIFSGVAMTAAKNKNANQAHGFSIASIVVSAIYLGMLVLGMIGAFVMMRESKAVGGSVLALYVVMSALYVTAVVKSMETMNRAKEGKLDEAASAATVSFGVQLAIPILLVLAMFGLFGAGVYVGLKESQE